jgi:hypothetical protein
MGEPVTHDHTEDSTQGLPPMPDKRTDEETPMQPNPYMGGGEPPA